MFRRRLLRCQTYFSIYILDTAPQVINLPRRQRTCINRFKNLFFIRLKFYLGTNYTSSAINLIQLRIGFVLYYRLLILNSSIINKRKFNILKIFLFHLFYTRSTFVIFECRSHYLMMVFTIFGNCGAKIMIICLVRSIGTKFLFCFGVLRWIFLFDCFFQAFMHSCI